MSHIPDMADPEQGGSPSDNHEAKLGSESAVLDDMRGEALPEEEQTRSSNLLVWLLAIVFGLLVAGLAPLITRFSGVQAFGYSYLPTLPLILLAALAMFWNPLVRLCKLSFLQLHARDLLLIGAMTYLVAGVALTGLSSGWASSLISADTFQRNRSLNPSLGNIEDAKSDVYGTYPRALSALSEEEARRIGDEASLTLVRGLRDGHMDLGTGTADWGAMFQALPDGSGGKATPFSRAQEALGSSAPIIIFGILLMLGLVAATARQWTHNERLQHPLVQVPAAMAEGSLLRQRSFQVTLGGMLLFWLYQLGSSYGWHPLPAIRTDPLVNMPDFYQLFGIESPGGWPRTILREYWGSIRVFPFAIGVAFLLASDVGFSTWGGFFFGVIVVGWFYAAGIDVNFSDHGRLAGGGATMAMALVVLWLGRLHYWRLLQAAFLLKSVPNDPLGVLGVRVLLLSAVGLILVLTSIFGSFWASVLAVLLMLSFLLVIARVVAESGLACFQAAHTLGYVTVGLGLPLLLPLSGMLASLWASFVMVEDTRNNLTGYASQSFAMIERGRQPMRLFFVISAVVVIAAAGLAVVVHLYNNWTGTGMGRGAHFYMPMTVSQVNNPPSGGLWNLSLEQWSIFAGVLMVFAVVGLRRIWYACPLHPIGLVVATSWPIFLVWGSLFLGWLAKILVLRYGGSQLYKQVKPVAIALILGDALGFGLQMILQLSISGVDPWRQWP